MKGSVDGDAHDVGDELVESTDLRGVEGESLGRGGQSGIQNGRYHPRLEAFRRNREMRGHQWNESRGGLVMYLESNRLDLGIVLSHSYQVLDVTDLIVVERRSAHPRERQGRARRHGAHPSHCVKR